MAAINKKKKATAVKIKKKKWYPLFAPKQFQEVQLGETYISESTELANKYLTANLSTISKSMRKQNVNIHFRVVDVKDGKGYTKIIGYSLINAAIKRLVRRGRDKIADSFICKTNDKQIMRLKPLIINMHQGTKSVQSAIRLEARRVIKEFVYTKSVEEVFAETIDGKLQKLVKDSVGKIAPVKNVELRIVRLEENTKIIVTDKEVVTEAVTIRKREKGEQHISEEEKAAIKAAKALEAAKLAELEGTSEDNSEEFGDEEDEEFEDDEEVEDEESETEDIVEKPAKSAKIVLTDEPSEELSEEAEATEEEAELEDEE